MSRDKTRVSVYMHPEHAALLDGHAKVFGGIKTSSLCAMILSRVAAFPELIGVVLGHGLTVCERPKTGRPQPKTGQNGPPAHGVQTGQNGPPAHGNGPKPAKTGRPHLPYTPSGSSTTSSPPLPPPAGDLAQRLIEVYPHWVPNGERKIPSPVAVDNALGEVVRQGGQIDPEAILAGARRVRDKHPNGGKFVKFLPNWIREQCWLETTAAAASPLLEDGGAKARTASWKAEQEAIKAQVLREREEEAARG